MGTPRGGNGDEQPPGGGGPFDGVPGVPPEWGPVVIPDDASALDEESVEIRREFRRGARRYRWRRRLHLIPTRNRETTSLGVPLAIMAIAVVATMISLFVVAWPGSYGGSSNPATLPTRARPLTLPDLTLYDSDGVKVAIRDSVPAVVLLVDGCACARVVAELVAAVDPRVSVLVVLTPDPNPSASASGPGGVPDGGNRPGPAIGPAPGAPPAGPGEDGASTRPGTSGPAGKASPSGPPGVRLRQLLDPGGYLRASVPGLPSPGPHGIVLLVSSDWAVERVVTTTTPVRDLKADLARLVT